MRASGCSLGHVDLFSRESRDQAPLGAVASECTKLEDQWANKIASVQCPEKLLDMTGNSAWLQHVEPKIVEIRSAMLAKGLNYRGDTG